MLTELQSDDDDDSSLDNDIDLYFDSSIVNVPINEKEDQTQWTLNWWNANQCIYPLMARAARDYLAIPLSEVDIERFFSDGRDILGVRRWSMSGATMRALTILKDNI
jgi:hypothetical protein